MQHFPFGAETPFGAEFNPFGAEFVPFGADLPLYLPLWRRSPLSIYPFGADPLSLSTPLAQNLHGGGQTLRCVT